MRKMSRYAKQKLKRKVIRVSIIVGAALLFSIIAVIIVSLMDKKIESYYPHDERLIESVIDYNNIDNIIKRYFVCSNI